MALLTSERERFYQEDVAGGVSVSEFLGGKFGSNINFIYDRIVQVLEFGVSGAPYSGLSAYPYLFSNNNEVAIENYELLRVTVANQISGTSGQTEFKIERRPFGSGTWTNIFSTNCIIQNTAADALFFSSEDAAPSGVTLPVLNISSINAGDELRFTLISAALGASDLKIRVEVGPV